ncbi:MAG TPA: DUF885 domain-containing protein [Kofleriaceae bacterium]|jgi:uncharacterized protein (DUF885 family)|nr:DUF885 domain-containing protein [Kofleriaceae bacterium]
MAPFGSRLSIFGPFVGRLGGPLCGPILAAALGCSSPPAHPPASPATPVAGEPAPAAAPAASPASADPAASPDQAFAAFSHHLLEDLLRHSPTFATHAGDHRYDDRWPDVSVQGQAAERAFIEQTRAALARLPRDRLSEQNQIDAGILDDRLRSMLFSMDELKPYDTDPMAYVGLISNGIDPLVTREFGTKESRMASLAGRLDGVPAIVAVAKQRLGHAAKVFTETAIQQNKGLIGLIETRLPARFAEVPAEKDRGTAAASRAAAALHDLQNFLETDLLPRSDGSFRLGRERFAKKLAFALGDDVDIDTVAADARALLERTQAEMVDTAKQIWTDDKLGKLPPLDTPEHKKAFVKRVLDHVAADHPTNQTILADARRWLDKATAFVRDQNLVRVPDEPVAVIEMPEYKRGVAVAYCDSSGALEAQPQTFFAIAPAPSDWPKQRVESLYREYNQAMLADLAIHEAMPGHYLQLMHNNQFASKLRAVFGSGPFIEGWAVYAEWMMAEHGFGGPRVKLQRQKMMLRTCANAILDHDIHAGTMDEAAALALMKNEAFQEDGEAVGKWKRARLSSAQLTTYFYGFTELLKLRHAVETQPGFSERAYHDRLLSWGSPPMKFVRQLVLEH